MKSYESIKSMSLGNLIGELLDAAKEITSIKEENDTKINLINYHNAIKTELDKREENYNSYKDTPIFR